VGGLGTGRRLRLAAQENIQVSDFEGNGEKKEN